MKEHSSQDAGVENMDETKKKKTTQGRKPAGKNLLI
jgi:hypothetical protein